MSKINRILENINYNNYRNFEFISGFPLINSVSESKVKRLMESMMKHGWKGAPILYCDLGLITGSHRVEALKRIDDLYYEEEISDYEARVLYEVEILDVDDIIQDYSRRTGNTWNDIDFDYLREIFKGTYVEKYKNDIVEW